MHQIVGGEARVRFLLEAANADQIRAGGERSRDGGERDGVELLDHDRELHANSTRGRLIQQQQIELGWGLEFTLGQHAEEWRPC